MASAPALGAGGRGFKSHLSDNSITTPDREKIFTSNPKYNNVVKVGVAQLVRASVCGTEGRRFESAHPPHGEWRKWLAHTHGVRGVAGSSPASPTQHAQQN